MRSLLFEQLRPLAALFRQDDLVSLAAEHVVEELQHAWLIIDHKNFGHGIASFSRLLFPARSSTPSLAHHDDHQTLINVT
jgi:hypothetical protein